MINMNCPVCKSQIINKKKKDLRIICGEYKLFLTCICEKSDISIFEKENTYHIFSKTKLFFEANLDRCTFRIFSKEIKIIKHYISIDNFPNFDDLEKFCNKYYNLKVFE